MFMNTPDTLKIMIARRDIRQRTIAEALHVSDQDVSLWVNGKRDIPAFYVKKLAKVLRVPVNAILAVATKDAPK